MKKKVLSILALLLMAAGGAWAQTENSVNVRQLTRQADGSWLLDAMPGYNGLLQVTFFERFKLDSIPMTWTITVNGADSTQAVTRYTEGDTTMGWLMIYETAAVRLDPPAEVKPLVKSVTVEETVSLKSMTIGGVTITYVEGDTWEDVLGRAENADLGMQPSGSYIYRSGTMLMATGYGYVNLSDPVDATKNYYWVI